MENIQKQFFVKLIYLISRVFWWSNFNNFILYFFPGILLSNFDSEFTNQYYHSIYDNSTSNGYDHDETNQVVVENLAAVAETVTATIFELFGKKNAGGQPSFDFKGKANR